MTEKLSTLFMLVSDELNAIQDLQEIIDIAVEQGQEQDLNKRYNRTDLLIRAYQSQVEFHFSELTPLLAKIRSHLQHL